MAFELLFSSRCDDQISDLWRQETSQPAHPLNLANLVGHTLFKLLVQLVQIVKQSRILDGDHGLVGEGGGQLNLPVREGPYNPSPQDEDSDWYSFPQKWNAEKCADPAQLYAFSVCVLGVG